MSTVKDDIKEYLAQEGLRPQEDEYGIYFRYQMLTFLIHWEQEDEFFLSISLPAIFTTDENNRADALEAINAINVERKVVKCVLGKNDVWINSEQLLDSTPKYEDIIPRTLNMLLQARAGFYEQLRKL
jgi:hypothetical protein